jgi:hypothetical protein
MDLMKISMKRKIEKLKEGEKMNCPRCEKEMIETTKQGVVIDHCPSCGGIWLDKGELGKFINQMKEADASLDAEFRMSRIERRGYHEKDYGGDDYNKHHYKKNRHSESSLIFSIKPPG